MRAHPGGPAELVAGPVRLRSPRRRDARAWSEVRMRNQEWLSPWEATSSLRWADRNSITAWPSLLAALRKAARAGTMLPFIVTYGSRLVGQVDVSNGVPGALRRCSAGHWIDPAAARRRVPTPP